MSLEHLWAGWRGEYVRSAGSPEGIGEEDRSAPAGGDPCVFCRIAASGPPSADNGVVWVGAHTFVVLNAFPYSSGHLMALPIRHIDALDQLTGPESSELWAAVRAGVVALGGAYAPEGVNLGANLGQAAGAGIPRHLHLHAVPRWVGDTNFMTSVGGTRVLPETLAVSWQRVVAAWPAEGSTEGAGGGID